MNYAQHRIIVGNSHIIIDNYNMRDCPQLEKNFSVYNPVYHRDEIVGLYYDKETKRLYLPRGIDITYVKRKLHLSVTQVEYCNDYLPSVPIKMKYGPRDNDQRKALRFSIGAGEYESNKYEAQLSFNMPTGFGKTYVSVATMSIFGVKSIIITGSTSLLLQWKNDIFEYTNLQDSDLMFLSGSQMLESILNNSSPRANKASVFLCTHGTIRSFCKQYGWNRLNDIFKNLGIGIKFVDESHKEFLNILMVDFFTNVWRTYYVTATPLRSDTSENIIFQLSLKNVPSIELFKEDSTPHTDYIAIKYSTNPSPQEVSSMRNAYGLDRLKYIDYATKKPEFYRVLHIIMNYILTNGGRALIYIGTNEAILRVYEYLLKWFPELGGDIGIFTSLVNKEEKAKEREKRIILSTTKSAGAGEDIKHLKFTVVLCEPFKSIVLARQTLGRTRDKDTTYIELVDIGFYQLKNYYYSKLPTFSKYALSTSDTSLASYELTQRSDILMHKQKKKLAKTPIYFYDQRFQENPEYNYPPQFENPYYKINNIQKKPVLFFYDKDGD